MPCFSLIFQATWWSGISVSLNFLLYTVDARSKIRVIHLSRWLSLEDFCSIGIIWNIELTIVFEKWVTYGRLFISPRQSWRMESLKINMVQIENLKKPEYFEFDYFKISLVFVRAIRELKQKRLERIVASMWTTDYCDADVIIWGSNKLCYKMKTLKTLRKTAQSILSFNSLEFVACIHGKFLTF